ncbi:MurR/RpiR family transcriptional regulator [Antarcticimicrobium sediminis]|uniref:MurR/RpiR family transcriptional regulator n=1 Tax=Antarcticimicrobium sediminis TaxID=2546227 RepID=A0A4V2Z7K2_9RHOB|nr:MurR/RpiR family transcriptional regulator [Antarcticimicrobium sediminis]TDE36726.1 MurR/RpiR family transcriptional regulator [Antarcticimicrobium sediminis]
MPTNEAEIRPESLLKRIHEAYSALPGGERKVADAILNAPSEMAVWTASELAGHAGVSNATVSRIIQRLGYRNFEAARQDARKLREIGSPLFMNEKADLAQDDGPYGGLVRAETEIIEATLSRLDMAMLHEVAEAIAGARQIRTLGFRNSRFLADYFTAQIVQMRPNVAPLVLDGQTVAEGIAGLGEGDVVIVIGLRRRPARFSRLVQAIAARKARLVLLADSSLREAPAYATWVFDCVVDTSWSRDSYVGALALLRLLAIECGTALGEAGRQHLNTVETLREDLDELEILPGAL